MAVSVGAKLKHHPAEADVRTARLLVAGQFVLIGILVVLPSRHDWPVPAALTVACRVATVVGLAVMVIGATGLGRGLTATPLPNAHAQLRTGGPYRFVRHPIYSGLLLTMASIAVTSGRWFQLLTLGALVLLLSVKARWEEARAPGSAVRGIRRLRVTNPEVRPGPDAQVTVTGSGGGRVTAASLLPMDQSTDTNAAIWKSEEAVQNWTATADERERKRAAQWRFMGELLPFCEQDAFTFLDLGAGTGAAATGILSLYPHSTAILADFSPQMMGEGQREMERFAGRFQYVEFDMSTDDWPAAIPTTLDAVVTSMCIHHMPDQRKQGLFAEILEHLAPGGWYLNYDPVTSTDPIVEATWERVNDHDDPEAASKRLQRTPQEQSRHENHVRYMIPLEQQLGYLRSAGFHGIDVYWKQLENVIYGGRRPA